MADILGIMGHIQQQGEKGRQSGLARLLGKAYNAPPDQRQAMLGQVARHDGGLAMQAGRQFREEDGEVLSQLSDHARTVVALYKADPNMAQQAYQAMLPLAQRAGISSAPQQLDDTVIGGLTQLAEVNQKAGASGVQSTQIGDDGYFYTVDRATGKFVNSGVKASPSLRIMEQEGQLPYGVVTGRGSPGSVIGIGGGQQAPQQNYAPQPQPTQFIAPDGVPTQIDPSLPPEVQAAIRGNPQAWAQAPDQSRANIGPQPAAQPQQLPPALDYQRGGQVGPVRIPTAAEQAAAKTVAERSVGLQFAPAETQAAVDRATQVKAAEAGVDRGVDALERTRSADDALTLLDEAEALLPAATGSGVGSLIDRGAGFIGATTPGAQATAALKAIAGQLVAKMPRMEGPQSDKDVQMYKDMAGNLADDTIPVPQRLAAAAQIRRLQAKYAGRPVAPPEQSTRNIVRARNPQTGEVVELRNGQWVPVQ